MRQMQRQLAAAQERTDKEDRLRLRLLEERLAGIDVYRYR